MPRAPSEDVSATRRTGRRGRWARSHAPCAGSRLLPGCSVLQPPVHRHSHALSAGRTPAHVTGLPRGGGPWAAPAWPEVRASFGFFTNTSAHFHSYVAFTECSHRSTFKVTWGFFPVSSHRKPSLVISISSNIVDQNIRLSDPSELATIK